MFPLPSSALFFFFNRFIAFKIVSLCFLSLFVCFLTCQVGLFCQLSLNQPAECRKFRSLPPLPGGAGYCCVASANRHKVKQSPTFEMIVQSIIRNVRYDAPDQFHQSSDRLFFLFFGLFFFLNKTLTNNETLICIYYLFMFKGTGVTRSIGSISHLRAPDVTSLCFSRVCFGNAGEYAHIECIESCLLSTSFSTTTVCTPGRSHPPALRTSSVI